MITPMVARLVRDPFDRPGWFFELKWDGFRAIAETDGVSTGEVVRTALERLIATRKLRRFAALGREHATRLGLTEEDVPRLIEETRKSHPR